jgi:hypothetical protein
MRLEDKIGYPLCRDGIDALIARYVSQERKNDQWLNWFVSF